MEIKAHTFKFRTGDTDEKGGCTFIGGSWVDKNTDELFIILEGEIKIILTDIKSEKSKEVLVKEGDVFVIKRKIIHSFFIIKDTKWINGLSQKMDKENPDFHY